MRMLKMVSILGGVSLWLSACAISPVDLSANVSSGGVDKTGLRGRTVYLKVTDARPDKHLGIVHGEEGELTLEASKSPASVVRHSIERTLKSYGMTIVDSLSDSDNQMFVSLKDLEYEYPVATRENASESSAALRVSLAGEKTVHENVIQTWSRYETTELSGGSVRGALSEVLGRAVKNALTEKKLITVLAGH